MKTVLLTVVAGVLAALLAAAAFVYSGIYNVAADDPHTAWVARMLETVRVRSVERRAQNLQPPKLDDPAVVQLGAGRYAEMCAGCHLGPGVADNPMRRGMNPQPPKLFEHRLDPADAFWVTKHGIRMTGMPAWGGSHDDRDLWNVIAFVARLPDMTPAQYKDLVRRAPPDDHGDGQARRSRQPEAEPHRHGETRR